MKSKTIYTLENCLTEYPMLLDTKQVAKILRIGRNSTLKLLHSGKIRTIRCGHLLFAPKTAIIDFLNGKPQEALENVLDTCYNGVGERRNDKEDVVK